MEVKEKKKNKKKHRLIPSFRTYWKVSSESIKKKDITQNKYFFLS